MDNLHDLPPEVVAQANPLPPEEEHPPPNEVDFAEIPQDQVPVEHVAPVEQGVALGQVVEEQQVAAQAVAEAPQQAHQPVPDQPPNGGGAGGDPAPPPGPEEPPIVPPRLAQPPVYRAFPVTGVDVHSYALEERWWQKWGRAVRRAALTCCCASDTVRDWDRDEMIRQLIAGRLLVNTSLVEVVRNANRITECGAKFVPDLIAKVVVTIEQKYGHTLKNRSVPGNVSIVRQQAAKLMREAGVREETLAVNLEYVERAYFEDRSRYGVANWDAVAVQQSSWLNYGCVKCCVPDRVQANYF